MENKSINKIYIIIASVILIIIAIILIFILKSKSEQYIVRNGSIETTEVVLGYLIKNEVTIDKDNSKVLVPVIPEGLRVSKDEIIATYKGAEYTNYEETLKEMDKEILELMKDLPTVYSSEVDNIENNIYSLVKESINESSYSKMQEYKQKINSYINKKANIIGELSPSGAKIKELIAKRNEYENQAKKSNDNIIAPMGGIVEYSVDGLEDKLKITSIEKLNFNEIENIVKTRSKR